MTATILAIDSAIGISSVAIWHGRKVAVYLEDRESTMQSARLMPLVEAALAQAGLSYGDITRVAATVGPGSFTGIRIGLAAARGIAFAAGIPCVGYTTLEVMHAAGGELCILNAGKGEVFYQVFGENATEPAIGKLDDILARYPNAIIASSVSPAAITHPRADALARLAATHPENAVAPSPFYIRPPDAKPAAQFS
ncbi:MAG: tRNA (adenosine(37)-N6)-threonylcarbamoyltransferase complex dimerization subunit type 1 TsaB [Alphaproteobacteria bacterium]|nr:tRNA (adenosine(37)-N6)-threonylcarbamoyltransferase complex dimerization subunit type 1 TsaB [Alphaproteobacteria bacterium]